MKNRMKVLIAYDGVHPIEYFLRDLKRAGLPNGVDAFVLTVVESYLPPAASFAGISIPQPSLVYIETMYKEAATRTKKELTRAQKMADRAAKKIQSSFREWSVKPEACTGSPSSVILKKADEWKPDLIIMGSHGASAAARFFLGSVSRSVLIHSKCSVRIVRKNLNPKEFVRLVIGMDGSPDAQMAVQAVSERVWPKGTTVRLVTGFDQNMVYTMAFHHLSASKKSYPREPGEKAWIRQMTEPFVERLEHSGLRVSDVIKAGKPWKVLAEEAEKWKADCVFVGARGLGRFNHFLLGSVSNTVASRARCSVEVVRKS